jgi:hypothetical protein
MANAREPKTWFVTGAWQAVGRQICGHAGLSLVFEEPLQRANRIWCAPAGAVGTVIGQY